VLVNDLLGLFAGELVSHAWGCTLQIQIPLAPTRTHVPDGRRPTRQGEILRRYATWHYEADVADPRTPVSVLAERDRDLKRSVGLSLQTKHPERINDNAPDTKLVRFGIAEAKRYLGLVTPPWEWGQRFLTH